MIIVKIFEGIGNQMFQYAYARRQSMRYNVPFKLYLVNKKEIAVPEQFTDDEKRKFRIVRRWYENDSMHREYLLNTFAIQGQFATEIEVYDTIKCNGKNYAQFKWNQFKNGIMPYYKKSLIQENPNICFDKNLLKTNSNCYVEGYFSSERYFEDVAETIKKEFTFKAEPSSVNRAKMREMQQHNSVCISIRRGDFIHKPMHNVCTMDYFAKAIEYVSKKIEHPYFYVFSDDNTWARENFTTDFPHEFVTHNYPDYMEDFRLMSVCNHHIIPNSTFSWWAAWLAEKKDSIIIAPKKWLHTNTIDYSAVVPQRWITIDN
jgi:hypothetical protein